ncbi:MAG: GNAT family N-acetyltransferase [Alphaproteobacteria bacterium]|nr:GNAT family N-acetyltransferase [Alphaproteobacteria bacterium]
MENLSIAPADEAHAAVLSALHERCFAGLPETPWSETAMRTVLRMPGVDAWVACDADGEPCGLLVGRATGGDGEILTVCVMPEHRRRGVARALFDAFLARLPSAHRLVLEVAIDNEPAIALYMSLDFRPAGRRPGYYPGASERVDALILARET